MRTEPRSTLATTMLYKHDRLEKYLREHGRPATAEIVSIRTEGSGSSALAFLSDDSDLTTTWFNVRLILRIAPPGEAPFEVKLRTRLNTLKGDGDTVPVLYDPDDHDKVFVDYEADAQTEMARARPNPCVTAAPAGPAPLDPELQQLMESEEAERRHQTETHHVEPPHADAEAARLDQLERLADMHARGILTDAEFAGEKSRLLGG